MIYNLQISLVAIDVGNKFTVASIPRNRGVEILQSDSGSKQIPTIISYQNDKRVYTDQAEPQKITNRNQTFYYLPLILGEKIDSEAVKRAQNIGAKFGMKAGANNQVLGSVYFGDEQISVTTQNMMTALMHKIVKYAWQDGQQPSDVVLTVPPNWSADKKRQLRACAESCGLNVLGELPQHIAVSTNYYMRRVAEFQKLAADNPGVNVAFLSIGEVSSWFAVVKMNKQGIITHNIVTDMNLGSIDMDKVLVEIIKKQALAKCKQICLDDLLTAKTQIKLLKAANNAKKILTINAKAPATLECIGDFQVDIQTLIDLEDFNVALEQSGILERVRNLIKQGLQDTQIENLECIECVGGASRVRAVQQIIKDIFTEKKIGKRLNPDEAVSIGLGWCGALRSKKYHIPYTIGITDKITVLQQSLNMQIYNSQKQQILKQPLSLFTNGEQYPKLKKVTQRFQPGDYIITLSDGDVVHEITQFTVKPKNFEQFQGYQELAKDVVKFDDQNVMIEIKIQCDTDGYFKLSSLSRKDQKLIMETKTRQVENKNYEQEQIKYDEQIKEINDKYENDMKEYEQKKKQYEQEHAQYNKELAEAKTDEERKKIKVPTEPSKPQKQTPPNKPQKTIPEQYQEPKIISVSEQPQFQIQEAIYNTSSQAQELREFELKCQKIDQISLEFEKGKNDLDSVIYTTRDGLDYDLKPYITESEAQIISQQLEEARQFADTIEDKSQIKQIQEKVQYYQGLFKQYYDRKQSFSDLEEYEYKAKVQYSNIADKYIKYTDEKDVQQEIDKLQKAYNDMVQKFQQLDRHVVVQIDDFKKEFDKVCEDTDKILSAKRERIDKERAEAKIKADAEKKSKEEQKKQQDQVENKQ